ncbi:MAG: hypothetical protein JSR85_05220 [Proteobacteria bacterium]|nr:hypothetical protein [Pseudomonadota bacterium]
MKKISIALALILIVIAQCVGADDARSAPAEGCKQILDSCRSLSINLNPANSEECSNCLTVCRNAQVQCKSESKEKLDSASGHHLHCKQACPKSAAQEP